MRDLDIDMFYNKETGIYSCIRCQFRGTEEEVLQGNEDVRKKYKAMYKRFDKFDLIKVVMVRCCYNSSSVFGISLQRRVYMAKRKKTRWNSDSMSCHRENRHLCCAENPGRECMVMRNFTCISIICLKSASAAREMEICIWMRIFTSIMTAISHLYLRIFHMLQSAMVRW